ncbi:SHOCT domain-containing protein [Starkeya sp. ORNL1]|uniref:SHOCT domain-containing protein n=1 Tax=Starkeya sp. ORNL1 TaxID=2709380 RepID=UPI00146358E0|nr:SHOCT domain-containing protein [Starkeya sp. ORNL1]QJP17285.1 SHOCT domain-containing protein [Starkeya sp. ORNL1]
MSEDTSVQAAIEKVAADNGVSTGAAQALFDALAAGGGTMAQFSHPELGGMGQWSRGGMLMIGDMFNHGLKARVDRMCSQLAELAARHPRGLHGDAASGGMRGWWPEGLGIPSSSGAQNDMRYAFFPSERRLAISDGGDVTVYDTEDHIISGVSQQQGSSRNLAFTSQKGDVKLSDLRRVSRGGDEARAPVPTPTAEGVRTEATGADEIFRRIEGLSELLKKGILTEDEFRAKKAELLARL